MEENISLRTLIDSYSLLSVNDKRIELGREIAELSIVIKKLVGDLTGESERLNSIDEYDNLFDGKLSEADYLTGLYEDIIKLKELLGFYLSAIVIDNYTEE